MVLAEKSVGDTRRKQRTKLLVIFSDECLLRGDNILATLHRVKSNIKSEIGYWIFTPNQLAIIDAKLNALLGREKLDTEHRLHSIYKIRVKKDDGSLQNRKSWSYVNID